MAYTPSSYATTPREEAESPHASPAPSPPPCPPLSATRVKNDCYKCGDPGYQRVDDWDGAAAPWVCRDCLFAEPSSCEHCEEAARLGKAPVCSCERGKPAKKKVKLWTPPETPKPMDESE